MCFMPARCRRGLAAAPAASGASVGAAPASWACGCRLSGRQRGSMPRAAAREARGGGGGGCKRAVTRGRQDGVGGRCAQVDSWQGPACKRWQQRSTPGGMWRLQPPPAPCVWQTQAGQRRRLPPPTPKAGACCCVCQHRRSTHPGAACRAARLQHGKGREAAGSRRERLGCGVLLSLDGGRASRERVASGTATGQGDPAAGARPARPLLWLPPVSFACSPLLQDDVDFP